MNRILRLGAIAVMCGGLTVAAAQKSEPAPITEASFKCIRDMTPVRGFYVDNSHGNLKGTVAVANCDRPAASIRRAR